VFVLNILLAKPKKKNDVFQIKASQDTKPSNHNADMVEVPIIKEQEVLEPISYPENSTLHNNSRNSLETSSAENDLISNSKIKQQTQDITNLQDVCSIEDISSKKAPLEDKLSWTKNTRKRLVMRSGKEIGKKSFETWIYLVLLISLH
jgi:hypothetical protein